MASKGRWLVFTLLGALILAGCGPKGRGLPMAKVKGTVKNPGKDIPGGKIVFRHSSGEMAVAEFKADGKYELDVPVGKNNVMIQALVSSEGQSGGKGSKTMEVFTSLVPDKYADFEASKLELDVPEAGTTYDVTTK